MKNIFKNNDGLGLVEVIVALAVVITGVVSGLTLTTYNLNASVTSETRLKAANLAREGIEVVRHIRDGNWLAGNNWDQGIVDAEKYRFIVQFNPANNTWTTVSQTVNIGDCLACQLYLDEITGVFSHDNLKTPTSYKRLLIKRDICWQEIIGNEVVLAEGEFCDDYGLPVIGWQLESKITWSEMKQSHEISVMDKLYDWR